MVKSPRTTVQRILNSAPRKLLIRNVIPVGRGPAHFEEFNHPITGIQRITSTSNLVPEVVREGEEVEVNSYLDDEETSEFIDETSGPCGPASCRGYKASPLAGRRFSASPRTC